MLFKAKPVPPEWAHLTPEALKFCRKAERKHDAFDRFYIARAALMKGHHDAVAVILPTIRGSWGTNLLSYIFEEDKRGCREAILPALPKTSADFQYRFLCYRELADDEVYLQKVLEQITDHTVRARAVCAHLSGDGGLAEKAAFLCHAYLDAGVNVHHDGGEMLRLAVQKGQFDLASHIIQRGFDMASFGTPVYQRLIGEGASPEAIGWFKRRTGRANKLETAGQVYASPAADFTRMGDDSVVRSDTLPNGARLTMVFNFSSGQQLVYISEEDRLSPPAITSLYSMDNRRLLETAMAAFIDQQGDADIVAPFRGPAAIVKPLQPGNK